MGDETGHLWCMGATRPGLCRQPMEPPGQGYADSLDNHPLALRHSCITYIGIPAQLFHFICFWNLCVRSLLVFAYLYVGENHLCYYVYKEFISFIARWPYICEHPMLTGSFYPRWTYALSPLGLLQTALLWAALFVSPNNTWAPFPSGNPWEWNCWGAVYVLFTFTS